MNRVERLHEASDQMVAASFAQSNQPKPPCCAGCFSCCRESVLASFAEVQHLVKDLDAVQVGRVRERTKDWMTRFFQSGLQEEAEPYMQTYRALKLWCPLLEDGKCMVYDKRPVSCRVHFAYETRAGCDDDDLRPTQKFAIFQGAAETIGAQFIMELRNGDVEVHDHLGVLLSKRLLGVDRPTAARITYKAQGKNLSIEASQQRRQFRQRGETETAL